MTLVRIILALFLPPVAVFLTVGLGMHFWLSLVLTFFGWLPGVVHAFYVIGVHDGKRG